MNKRAVTTVVLGPSAALGGCQPVAAKRARPRRRVFKRL